MKNYIFKRVINYFLYSLSMWFAKASGVFGFFRDWLCPKNSERRVLVFFGAETPSWIGNINMLLGDDFRPVVSWSFEQPASPRNHYPMVPRCRVTTLICSIVNNNKYALGYSMCFTIFFHWSNTPHKSFWYKSFFFF